MLYEKISFFNNLDVFDLKRMKDLWKETPIPKETFQNQADLLN